MTKVIIPKLLDKLLEKLSLEKPSIRTLFEQAAEVEEVFAALEKPVNVVDSYFNLLLRKLFSLDSFLSKFFEHHIFALATCN